MLSISSVLLLSFSYIVTCEVHRYEPTIAKISFSYYKVVFDT
jgi:hypothetical protein